MKVLFSCSIPFFLAHGGSQTLAEALMRELQQLGVEVEPARWWDRGTDWRHPALHRAAFDPQRAAGSCEGFQSRDDGSPGSNRLPQAPLAYFFNGFLHASLEASFRSLPVISIGKYIGKWMRWLARYLTNGRWPKYLFDADPKRGHVIPHGLEESVLQELARTQMEEEYLICVATIDSRKNSVLLAEAAHIAQVPVLFLGKPYSRSDPYFQRFQELIDNSLREICRLCLNRRKVSPPAGRARIRSLKQI